MAAVRNPDDVLYREDHCVLRWPMVAAGLIAPVVAIASAVLAVTLEVALHSSTVFWVMMAVMMAASLFWIARGQLLVHWWPIGIRLRQDGVAIGGVRWAERHPGKRQKKASVLNQGYQVFCCPWDGVTWIWVETDPEKLKTVRRNATYGRRPTPLGNLSVPFMKAALIIRVDPAAADLPDIHRARNPLAVNYSSSGFHQDRWVAPTRHPERLRQTLAPLPVPPSVIIDPETADRESQG